MSKTTALTDVLSQFGGTELDAILRSHDVTPRRLKDDKLEQLVELLLSGAVDFENLLEGTRAYDLEVMCEAAGLEPSGVKRDKARRLVQWFAREFDDQVGAALSERGPAAASVGNDDEAIAGDEPGLDYECDIGAVIDIDQPEDRAYQAQALRELSEAFREHTKVVLSLPTGAGKTFVAAKWLADNVRGTTLWLTHREELVNQADTELRRVLPRDRAVTRWTSSGPKDDSGCVVIASVGCHTMPSGPFEALVVDEAHHRAAPSYQRWARSYRFQKELGLTATPERHDQLKLGYTKIVKRSFWELVEQHYLAAPIHHIVQTGESYDLRKDGIRDDFEEASLAQLDNPRRNNIVVEQFLKHRAEYSKTLVFAVNVAHAENLVEAFRRAAPQVRVASILGTTDKRQRAEIVEQFSAGQLDVLINCKVFVEGFNCRDIATIFLTRPTMSAVLYCQMVGRGTRIVGSKTTFNLVEFSDQLSRYTDKLAGFWNLGTRDLEVIREATERAKVRPADPPALLPPAQIQQWTSDLHLIGGVLAYWDAAALVQGATLVYKSELNNMAAALAAEGGIDRAALEAAFAAGHWAADEKQHYTWFARSGFHFHLYDFGRPTPQAPPAAPAAVAAIHTIAQQVAPLSEVEAFLGPPENIDWGGDANEWRRDFLAQRHNVAAVLRVTDDFTHRVTPQKVFAIEQPAVSAALAELERAKGGGGERFFGAQEAIYNEHLKGTSITRYKWFCIAKTTYQGAAPYLPLRTPSPSPRAT